MTSLARALAFVTLLAGTASAVTVEFIDPANNDYRLAAIRDVVPTNGAPAFDMFFFHTGSLFDIPMDLTVFPTYEQAMYDLNPLGIMLPEGALRTTHVYFPAGEDTGRLAEFGPDANQDPETWPPENQLYYSDGDWQGWLWSDRLPDGFAWAARTLPIPGDANADGLFNSTDLIQLMSLGQYYENDLADAPWTAGDFDRDWRFTTRDLVTALASGTYEQPAAAMSVPEPSGFLMLLMGLLLTVRSRSAAKRR